MYIYLNALITTGKVMEMIKSTMIAVDIIFFVFLLWKFILFHPF